MLRGLFKDAACCLSVSFAPNLSLYNLIKSPEKKRHLKQEKTMKRCFTVARFFHFPSISPTEQGPLFLQAICAWPNMKEFTAFSSTLTSFPSWLLSNQKKWKRLIVVLYKLFGNLIIFWKIFFLFYLQLFGKTSTKIQRKKSQNSNKKKIKKKH